MSCQYVLFLKTISPNVEFLDRGPQIIPTNPIAISLSSFSPFYPSLSTPDGTSKRIDGWLRRPRVTRLCMKGGCGER